MLYALKGNVCAEYLKNAWQHRLTKPKLTCSSVMHKGDGEGGDQVEAGVQLGDGVSVMKLIRRLS